MNEKLTLMAFFAVCGVSVANAYLSFVTFKVMARFNLVLEEINEFFSRHDWVKKD